MDDVDDVEVSPFVAFVLQRGPLIAVLVLAVSRYTTATPRDRVAELADVPTAELHPHGPAGSRSVRRVAR